MTDKIGFEVYEIRNLSNMKEMTIVDMRIYGLVNGIEINYKTTLWSPHSINTYNELSEHIILNVLSVELYKKHPEPLIECPNCTGVPLQNGECMVCGFKDVV